MNKHELAAALQQDGYSHNWYSFDLSSPPLEGFVLEKMGQRWVVFYHERGTNRDIANFEEEQDACRYFYQMMKESFASVLNQNRH